MNKQLQSVKENIDLILACVSSLVFSAGLGFEKYPLCFLGGFFVAVFYLLYTVKQKERGQPDETDELLKMVRRNGTRKVIKLNDLPPSYNCNRERVA